MQQAHAATRIVAALALGFAQVAFAQVPFGPLLLTAGQNPAWVAAGDVNGDTRVDIVCTNSGTGTISVFFANPAGGFASATALPAIAGSPAFIDLELADIDKDTRTDIVAATTSAVVFYRNLGNGAFAVPVTIQVGASCSALAIGDLDGDTWLDAAVSSPTTPSTVKVLRNNGAGVLLAPVSIALAAGAAPADLEIADLDGDTDLDIVTTSTANVAVLLNQGGAIFAAPQLYPTASSLTVLRLGDWNNDARPDAAVAYTTGAVAVLLNNGSGAFGAPNVIAGPLAGVNDISVGDLDRNGLLDIASSNNGGTVRVCLGLGGGSFAPATSVVSGGHFGLVVRDVDFDGRPDVVAARDANGQLIVLYGEGNGAFGSSPAQSLATERFVWGDYNGDGLLDVAGPRPSQSSMAVRLAQPGGGFGPETLYPDGGSSSRGAAGHIDADAHLDLVTQATDNRLRVLFGTGSGSFGAPVPDSFIPATSDMVLGDVDGDGLDDLVYAYLYIDSTGALQQGTVVTIGNGAGAFAFLTSETFGAASIVVADFNEDGAGDVAMSTNGSGVALRNSNGSGGLLAATYSNAAVMENMLAADINGDTHLDLIGAAGFYGVGVQLGDGLGNLTAQVTYSSPDVFDLAAADFDGDGDLDVVGGYDDFLHYFEGNGTGALTFRGTALHGGGFLYSIAAGDNTADGRVDVIVGDLTLPGSVRTVRNRGPLGPPLVYCTPKTTSNGCLPSIASSGTPSATATSGFTISCSNVINNKTGILFYSLAGRADVPFQSGHLCVKAPRMRTPLRSSNGNPPPDDCSGAFALDFNAFAHGLAGGSPSSALTIPGTAVTAQWWGRDPLSIPKPTMLSNAIDFVVHP